MINWRTAVVVAAVASSVGAREGSTTLEVKAFTDKDGRVLTSVTSASNWTPEVRELLQTGAWPVTFTYAIELRRPALLWDSVLARSTWVASAKLDTLSKSYQATRQRDGNILKVERKNQESEIREWLTIVEQVQLEPESPLRQNNDYYVTVKLYITPQRNVSIFWILPGGSEDGSGRSNFTYIR